MDVQHMYRVIYQYARNEVKVRGAESAFWAAERATHAWCDNFHNIDYSIDRLMDVSNAVLWAIHWKFFAKTPTRLWHSERRIGFVLATVESGEESRTWFEPAKLP